MRRFVSLTVAAILGLASTSAMALTQEEILKRRLDKMQQVDSQLRTEEQQRSDHIRESTAGVGSGPSKQSTETISIPDPVRKSHPEPKSGLFEHKAAPPATPPAKSGPAPAAQPAPVAQPTPMPPAQPAYQPAAKPAPTAGPVYQPVAQPAAQPAYQPTPPPMAQPAQAPLQQPAPVPPGRAPGSDPKTAASLAAMAAKAQANGDNQTALTLLDEAIAADPNDPDLRNNRGNIVSNLGRPREALADYDRAIAGKTTDPAFFTNRGLAHERLGNRERACADYKKACDLGDCEFFTSYKTEGNCR